MAQIRSKIRRFLLNKVLHADDSPHVIALGCGIAMFVALLPLVGLQTLIAIGIAAVFRANKAVCVPIVWITNPATLVPVYWGCLRVGQFVLPAGGPDRAEEIQRLSELASHASIFDAAFWSSLYTVLVGLGEELWVGCLVVGITFAVLTYFAVLWSVSLYRERRRRHQLRRSLLRSKFQRPRATKRREPA